VIGLPDLDQHVGHRLPEDVDDAAGQGERHALGGVPLVSGQVAVPGNGNDRVVGAGELRGRGRLQAGGLSGR
jgi:hypothetical protein